MMQTNKVANIPEKYIFRRYTKRPNIQPTFNRNDLRTVASNKASHYCIEHALLQLNMRVHRKSLRSQDQMVRAWVIMESLEQELDAMQSAANGDDTNNEAKKIEHDVATILSEMNHLGTINSYDNEEEQQQQQEPAHVQTQE
jgi:hypothetical protein